MDFLLKPVSGFKLPACGEIFVPYTLIWKNLVGENMFNRVKIYWVLPAILLLVACSSQPPQPEIDYKPDYDFAAIKTYGFAPRQTMSGPSMLTNAVEMAIEDEMDKNGIQLVPADKADVLVQFMVGSEDKRQVNTYQTQNYYRNCWRCGSQTSTEVRVTEYTEGAIIVDIIDPALNHSIWHAGIEGRVNKKKSSAERKQNVKQLMTDMFAHFPPGEVK